MNNFSKKCLSICCSLSLAMIGTFSAHTVLAQAPTATLVGTVTDASRAVVPNATVEIRNTATNISRTVSTASNGNYTVTTLDPGNYVVTISKQGFEKVSENNLVLQADQTARLDVSLRIGQVELSVDVSASVGLLNTETSSKGDVITPVEVAEIPLNGRDFDDLAFTVAGVQPSEQKAKGAEYVAGGSRSDSAGIYIDGINDESPRDAGPQMKPPLDSIQEFRMETSGYTAQYGRLSGAVVNMTTKSGGNKWHGSLFDYIRNDAFDALPYNFTSAAQNKSELRQNDFGGDFSGPVDLPRIYNGRNRTFFSLSLESVRKIGAAYDLGIVPTNSGGITGTGERGGDFSVSAAGAPYYFHNPKVANPATANCGATGGAGCLYPAPYDVIPSSSFDPVAAKLLAYYPVPNIPNASPGQNNYQYQAKSVSNSNNGLLRIDHKVSDKDQISGRLLRNFTYSSNPTAGSNLGTFGSNTTVHNTLIGIAYTRIFTPNLVNTFAFGRTRTLSAENANDGGTNYATQLGIPNTTTIPAFEAFPSFKPSGYETIGDNASDPISFAVNDFDGSDMVTWTHRNHNFKFGGDIFHVQLFQPTNTDKNGAFTYNGKFTNSGKAPSDALADMFAGFPATSILMTGGNTNHLFQTNYAGFTQDDYKASPKLTLNLGVRYELQTLPSEENGQLTNFVPALNQIVYSNASSVPNIGALLTQAGLSAYYVSAAQAGYPAALIHVNPLRISPRVGFAYRVFDNDRTVIRGGYGIFYTGIRLSVIRTNLAGQFPFSETTTYTAVAPSTTAAGSNLIASTNPFPQTGGSLNGILTPNGYDPNAKSANLQSYNLTVEQNLGWGIGLEVAYVGSKGTHLAQQFDYNQERVAGSAASRPLPLFSAITLTEFNGPSSYNSLQATLKRRFAHGIFFRANYTYAKSLDEQSGANYAGGGGSLIQNSLNPSAEYGLSDFDIRNTFSGTAVYRVASRWYALRDWQVAGDILAYTGQPFTPTVSGTSDLGQATRPNQICNGTLGSRTISEWFNPACFVVPTSGFGNAGRNILEGPNSVTLNLSLGRIFVLPEKLGSFELRVEGFNALNHPNFGNPTVSIGSTTTPGVISSINPGSNQRLVQLSGRYSF